MLQVSTHGNLKNQILVWRYPILKRIAALTGHRSRVLYMAISPDGETVVTGGGDETVRLWNVFSKTSLQKVSAKKKI
jgi:cell division cycle 20-like protein 1 (cofactor of APC complex)